MANISCENAFALITEAYGASCKSPRERNLLEIGLLWRAARFSSPSVISCESAKALIDEAYGASCKSPRERQLLELGILNKSVVS